MATGQRDGILFHVSPVERSHKRVDEHMAVATEKSAEAGRPVTCRGSGCFGCCKEPVYAERREVVAIVSSLSSLDLLRVRERTRSWWDAFFGGNFDQWDVPPPSGEVKDFGPILRYRAAALWCPLLSKGVCTAYAGRPSACRQHTAVGDPENCHNDARRPDQLYLYTDTQETMNTAALVEMLGDESPAMVNQDHLGVWLGHLLLGKSERSAAAQSFEIREISP